MTPEERFERIERNVEFLAANQARQDSLIAENSRHIGQLTAHIGQLDDRTGQLADQTGQLAEQTRQLADLTLRIGRVVEEGAARVDGQISDLTARLNALINIVERYFSNGKKPD